MRKILFSSILLLVTACAEKGVSASELVRTYYEGFQKSDYQRIKNTLADSLKITEGDYTMLFSAETYYEHFQWDSVFQPEYRLLKVENKETHVLATASVSSIRFEFLKNNPLTCTHRFYVESGKIIKIQNLDCPDADWNLWQKERDSLVNWIKKYHPELDGFIHDLSMKGAINYQKAIERYQKQQFNFVE